MYVYNMNDQGSQQEGQCLAMNDVDANLRSETRRVQQTCVHLCLHLNFLVRTV